MVGNGKIKKDSIEAVESDEREQLVDLLNPLFPSSLAFDERRQRLFYGFPIGRILGYKFIWVYFLRTVANYTMNLLHALA